MSVCLRFSEINVVIEFRCQTMFKRYNVYDCYKNINNCAPIINYIIVKLGYLYAHSQFKYYVKREKS